ncbi:DUF2321 domain-containing protein [Bacillus thuringiensis]|uniref:DUF2321 domain-containing protein n=1 Tax=Bacillus thuringiensis TaxID=1428 RepID=UPI000BFDBD78|nr:DUF2321 domain-containing protein [Bacillus thuringiensis]PGW31809.1 hypothetical protein COE03_31050 [Bacillus thuringiensis]
MSGKQFFQLICLNGHQISFFHNLHNDKVKFCEKCGESTINTCQNCKFPIEGYFYPSGIITMGPETFPIPSYCKNCGYAYPWTESILTNAVELIALDDNLDSTTKEIIQNAIPDLLIDSPTTPIAVAKYKKYIENASSTVKNGMRSLLVDVLSETVKKSIFG